MYGICIKLLYRMFVEVSQLEFSAGRWTEIPLNRWGDSPDGFCICYPVWILSFFALVSSITCLGIIVLDQQNGQLNLGNGPPLGIRNIRNRCPPRRFPSSFWIFCWFPFFPMLKRMQQNPFSVDTEAQRQTIRKDKELIPMNRVKKLGIRNHRFDKRKRNGILQCTYWFCFFQLAHSQLKMDSNLLWRE